MFAPKVTKRLQQELMTLMMSGQKGISAFPEGDKLFTWVATVEAPQQTVYAGESQLSISNDIIDFEHRY